MQTNDYACEKIDEIKVKGKEEPVTIYAPLFDTKFGGRKEVRKLHKTP